MRIFFAFGISLLLTLSSCLTIVQPLVTLENILQDSRMEGSWTDNNSRNIAVQKFMNSEYKNIFKEVKEGDYTKADSLLWIKMYVLSYKENEISYEWLAKLTKIGEQHYLELAPERCLDNKGAELNTPGMSTASIAKLEWKNNNSIELKFLNGDRIKEIILDGKARVKYDYDPLFETFVITASSTELQKFLEKYGNYERIFSGGEVITLTRKN